MSLQCFQKEYIINKPLLKSFDVPGGDDGWWEGEVQGRVGLFPSLVVEPVLDTVPRSPASVSPYKSTSSGPERLEIVEFDSVADMGLSKVIIKCHICIINLHH